MSQAILTTYHGCTATKPNRIKVRCQRGWGWFSITHSPHTNGSAAQHAEAARWLADKFADEDELKHDVPSARSVWRNKLVTGGLPGNSGRYAHVFVD